MPPKKKMTSEGESQKKARATAKKGRNEDDDAEKEVEQAEPPNKKTGKKEDRPTTSVASATIPPTQSEVLVHPLAGKTVVLDPLVNFKVSRNVHKAAILAAGGKNAGSLSSETGILVTGKKGSEKGGEAINRGITVWTEDDLLHVEKTGKLPVHKNPACFHKLETTEKLSEDARSFLLNALGYRWRRCEAAGANDYDRALGFYFPKNRLWRHGTECPKVHEYGADVIAPIITEWPGSKLVFYREGELKSKDIRIVMDAIAARSDKLKPMTELQIQDKKLIDDAGARAIANTLHKTKLKRVDLRIRKITEKGVKALLSALEMMPHEGDLFVMSWVGQCLAVQIPPSAVALLREWKAGSGKNSKWGWRSF